MALARILFEFAATLEAAGEESVVSSLPVTGDVRMLPRYDSILHNLSIA